MIDVEKGYVDVPVDSSIDLVKEIKKLKEERGAVIYAHYYQRKEIQQIADHIGDSLALAQMAEKSTAKVIVLCGVNFMAETAKILCRDKIVICPDLSAGCSLADSCPADKFAEFVKAHPGHKVISYVNTTAATKMYTDIVVTSTNARQIVDSFDKETPLIFGPDRNLGSYINNVTGRNMLLWDGACHVHEKFSHIKISALKKEYPDAKILAHPECSGEVVAIADKVGSTQALLNFAINDECSTFIVATESGILHEMERNCPDKKFIPAPSVDDKCGCNECEYMKQITLEKLYNSLKYLAPQVEVSDEVAERAVLPIKRMLEVSRNLGLIK